MKILIACEYSGTVRDAIRAADYKQQHHVVSADLLPCESKNPGFHYQGDALDLAFGQDWDCMIAHPPCTYLANSGVSWLHRQEDRWEKMRAGAAFFKQLLDAHIDMIAVENPIPHKYAVEIIGKYDQLIQPYQFGHPERKATCLWLKNLPELKPTNDVKAEMLQLPKSEAQRLHWLPPSADRAKLRSLTYQGIADAMAMQWTQGGVCQ